MRKNYQPVLWGLLHGVNDFAAGFMLAHYTFHHTYSNSFLLIVIYSIIGFGGQLPVGFWLDYKKQLKPFAIASLVLLPCAVISYFFDAATGIICSGIASALVHVTGGAICLQEHQNKTGPLALFTAPGVLGLTIGGILGKSSVYSLWFAVAAVLIIAFFILKNNLPQYYAKEKKESELDAHDLIMLGILLVMCFRSFIFDVINNVAQHYPDGLFIIGVSAFAGKILGGFIADKIGWKKFVYITLPLALLFFQLGKDNIYALAFGIACLQSSVPITLLLMSKSLPLYPATATALSLGTSVAIAGLPIYVISENKLIQEGFNNNRLTALLFSSLLVIVFILLIVTRKKQLQKQ